MRAARRTQWPSAVRAYFWIKHDNLSLPHSPAGPCKVFTVQMLCSAAANAMMRLVHLLMNADHLGLPKS